MSVAYKITVAMSKQYNKYHQIVKYWVRQRRFCGVPCWCMNTVAMDRISRSTGRSDQLPVTLLCGDRKSPNHSPRRSPRPAPHNYRRHVVHQMWCTTFDAADPPARFGCRGGNSRPLSSPVIPTTSGHASCVARADGQSRPKVYSAHLPTQSWVWTVGLRYHDARKPVLICQSFGRHHDL
jgi:hypothetical protein